jgi:hypothetical protein
MKKGERVNPVAQHKAIYVDLPAQKLESKNPTAQHTGGMCESSSMKRKFNHMNPSAEDTI